jgi:hypothetical protein
MDKFPSVRTFYIVWSLLGAYKPGACLSRQSLDKDGSDRTGQKGAKIT